jgi:hypothetical protein
MVSDLQKAETLKRRLQPLVLSEDIIAGVAADVKRNPRQLKSLFQEWIADVSTFDQNEYLPAARDPEGHFRRWLTVRLNDPFHISDLILKIVRKRYDIDFTTKLYMIVWWQEIAWAQRHRLADNAFTASKAGFFLAKAESDPKEVFLAIADLYASAVMTAEYRNSPLQEMAPEEIRHTDLMPDFVPLFLQYTNKFLSDKLSTLSSDQITQTAQAAARKERSERMKLMTERAVAYAERYPMCHDLSLIRIAMNQKLSSNDLFLLEKLFLDRVRSGLIQLSPGSITPQTSFVTLLADRSALKAALKETHNQYGHQFQGPDIWNIVGLQRKWIDGLPEAYGYMTNLMRKLGSWQELLAVDARTMPYDAISDFGFYLLEQDRVQ